MTLARLPSEALPDWPRFLRRPLAAAYLGVGEEHFDKHVAVDVAAIAIGGARVWDRRALDAWADKRSTAGSAGVDWAEALDASAPAAR